MTPKRLLYRLTRSGGAAIDPITYPQRAKPFGAAVRALRGVTLLTVRTTTGLDCYVMAGAKSATQADRMADTLAHTLAAKAERTDELPDLSSAPAIARLFARPTQSVSRDSQSGAEPAEVPQTILRVAEPGSWIAVTLRAPRRTEVDRARRWNARRATITTHHSLDSEVLVASFVAGGPSERSAAFLLDQMVSALPGMDVDTRAKAVTDTAVVATAGALAALVYGTGAALSTLSAGPAVSAAVMVTELLAEPLWAGAVASAPLAAIAMFGALGWLPTARRSLSTGAKSLSFPAPTAGGRRAPEPTPDKPDPPNPYPLAATSFLVGPSVVAAVAAPHAGAASGSSSTAARSAPPALRQDIGAMIGHAGPAADQPVHLSAGDATSGLMVLGIPDSGKMLSLDTPVPVPVSERFPSGWALNDELRVGDKVYSQDGSHTGVTDFSEVLDGNLFDVEFSDGRVVTADANHLWKVSTSLSRVAHDGTRNRRRAATEHLNEQEARRLRAVARETPVGAFAAAPELARLVGRDPGQVGSFATAASLPHETILKRNPASRQSRWAMTYDATELADAIDARESRVRSDCGRARWRFSLQETSRLRSLVSQRLSTVEAVRTMTGRRVPGDHGQCIAVKTIARRADLTSTTALADVGMVSGHRVGLPARVYPVGEFLLAWANRIESLGGSSRRGRAPMPLESVMKTQDLVRVLRTSDGKNNLAVAIGPVRGPDVRLPIPAYLLGAWLGDGSSYHGFITVGGGDLAEMTDLVRQNWPAVTVSKDAHPKTTSTIRMTTVEGEPFITLLRRSGLRRNKHIPALYLRASYTQRLALLQGLMDTDGSIDIGGACELTFCHERLAADALELIRSLGIKAGINSSDAAITETDPATGDKTRRVVGTRYRIHFSPRVQAFRLGRKAAQVRVVDDVRSKWLHVTDVRPVPSRKARCITVAHPSGMFLAGAFVPTHNSVLIRSAYAWNVLERVAPSGKPGRPGVQNTLIAFENKGEGAVEYQRWTDALGDDALRFDLADKTTPAIDLLAGPATAAAKAKQVAEAMAYAFPEGDIRRQSLSTLTIVMAAAQFVDDRVCEWTQTPAGTSVVEHAATLLGSDGEAAGVALAVALKRREMAEDNPQLTAVLKSMNPLYGEGVTPAQRRGLQDAPRTKIETLVEARDWFDPARPRVSWAQLLTGHENVIINAGVSDTGEMVSTEVTTVMSSMLLFTLRDAIQRHCSGWKDQGRSVSIFVDELSLLAAGSPEVITWLRNQGRSYGICQYLATQYPDQLHDQVRKAVLSFGSVFWFRQSNSEIAKMAADMLGVDGSSWDRSDIFNLPAHTAVLISQVNKEPQPAVPVAIGYWEPERRAYPGTQGYPSPEATLPRDRPWLRGVQAPVPDSMVQVQDGQDDVGPGPPADLPTDDPFDPRQFETPEPR